MNNEESQARVMLRQLELQQILIVATIEIWRSVI